MQRKNSHQPRQKPKELSFSIAQARKVYSSNKALKLKESNIVDAQKNYASIDRNLKAQPILRQKVASCYEKPNAQKEEKECHLPALKNIESDSTAEDLMQRINKKLGKQNQSKRHSKSYLLSRIRKNSHLNSQKIPTVTSENANQCPDTRRRVFQCKIIRSTKIPFPLPRKKSVEKRMKFEYLIAETENISEIKIDGEGEFMSPESQYLIDF